MIEGRTRANRRVAGAPVGPVPVVRENVPQWLATAGGWSWRLIALVAALAVVVYAAASIQVVFIAIFISLVITAVLRPIVDFLDRFMPRPLATALGMLTAITVFGGLMTYIIASVAGQWSSLSQQFSRGVDQIIDFLENGPLPFKVTSDDFNTWIANGQEWVQDHAGDLAGTAFQQAGTVAEIFTAVALAIFCSIFFLASGRSMWHWFIDQLPERTRETWAAAGDAGWYTFSGYTRGTVIIAITDGLLAGTYLAILQVPLAAPLGVLVFIGAFIPLVGAPLAMVVAMIVALASHGVIQAVAVGIGIALIGQLEGHVLQPLIMGKQVSLHPIVIAVAVASGTFLAGILGAVIAVPLIAVIWSVYTKLHRRDEAPIIDGTATDDGSALEDEDESNEAAVDA